MSRFPFFKEIEGSRVLVAGGGPVALRRAKILADFGAQVTCISPHFCEGFSKLNVQCILREFEPTVFFDWDIAIAATDDPKLNISIANLVKSQGGEVNVADNPDAGTFHFPSILSRGGMTVAISSDGASPSASKFVRERIEEAIPENFEAVLQSMETARNRVKELIPDQKERARILREIFNACLNAETQPDAETLENMIRKAE